MLVGCLGFILSGCGQRGALYHPNVTEATPAQSVEIEVELEEPLTDGLILEELRSKQPQQQAEGDYE
jgi:predicted small lipoprotein YifL